MAGLRVAELETLFTADTTQIEKADKDVKSIGERIEKKPITAKVDADAKGALAGMDRVEAQAKRLVSADTALKLDADIMWAERKLDSAKQKLEDLQVRALGGLDVTADVKRAEAALQKTERQVKALTDARQMIEVDANTEPSEQALRRVQRAAGQAGEDSGEEFGTNIVAALATIPIAGAVVGIGVEAGRALIGAFQDGMEQARSRDRLQGLTGITEQQAARIAMGAGEAYASVFGESIEANMDTARLALQFDIFGSDATVAESKRTIEGLAGIADVLGEDVRPVAQAVAVLLQTGVAGSAEDAYDLIAAGAREGLNRNEDLLDTLTEYPALFKRLGLDGPRALGLINQAMANGARNSDLAADALKEFQIRATDASEASAEGYRMLGLNSTEMTARVARGGEDAVGALDTVLDRLRETEDPVRRNAAAVALFGTQAEDLGEALFAMDVTTAIDGLNGVQGAARRMFDTLQSNDATSIERAQRNIEVAADGIKGALAAAFSEPLGDFADWVASNRGPLTEFLLGLANGALDFGRSMVIATADSTVAMGEFVAGPLREAVLGLRNFIEWLPGDADLSGLDDMIAQMDGFDETTANAAQTMRDTLIPNIDDAQQRMNEWAQPVVALGYLNDASLRLAESVGAVGVAADGSVLSMDSLTTATDGTLHANAELGGQLSVATDALWAEIEAAHAAGESQDQLRSRFDNATQGLVDQLTQMGLTEGQARDLIETYGLIPDGIETVVTAATQAAEDAIGGFIRRWDGSRLRVNVDVGGGTSYQVPGTNIEFNARGNLLEFMAGGGVRGLSPMAPVAQMVPPNTWRVVGDRSDVAEAYIPLDRSPRSMSILAETIRRMGGLPMADGGIVARGMSAGGGTLVGQLVLESGELVGIVRGVVAEDGDPMQRLADALRGA